MTNVTAPALAAFAALRIQVTSPANAELHYFDELALIAGNTTTWSAGGATAATLTMTLPAATTVGQMVGVKLRAASGTITINRNSTDLIYGPGMQGLTTIALTVQESFVIFVSDGVNWQVVSLGGWNPQRCSVTQSVAQADSANLSVTLHLNTKTFDPGTNFNTTTWTYTCPTAGVYSVDAFYADANTTLGDVILQVLHNGTLFANIGRQTTTATGGNKGPSGSCAISCTTGDTIIIQFLTQGSTASNVSGGYADFNLESPS